MASPDFSEYIDLTVNDLQPEELYAAALDYTRTALPEFEPRAGSVEDALLQSFSLINSLYIAAANRIPNGTIEGVLRLLGLERREDGVSTINASFTILTPGGTVLEGTSVSYDTDNDGEPVQYPFFVLQTASAAVGSNTVNVTLESLALGPLPSIPIGTSLTITQPSSELFTCVTTSVPSSAATAESDIEYLTRGVTYLNSLSNSLCTAAQIEAYILSTYAGVTRCKVYDLAYGSSTSPVSTTTTSATTFGGFLDVVIDCSTEDNQLFSFNDGLGLDIDGETVWVTTQQMYGSAEVTKEVFPSGAMGFGAEITNFDSIAKTVSISGIGVTSPAASANLGETMVQLVGGLTYALLDGTAPALRTPDARGMYVIFTWGVEGQPITFETKQAIYDDISTRTPVGIDAFIHTVMPVEVYVEVEIEVLPGYVASSVLADVTDYLNSSFSPEYYGNWSEYLYRDEFVVKTSEVTGVKRVVSVTINLPSYGAGTVTAVTGSTYFNNSLMAVTDPGNPVNPQYLQFLFAGSMPSVTANVSIYGS